MNPLVVPCGCPTSLTPYWPPVSLIREAEPWTALLEGGRADERLVHEGFDDAREPRLTLVPEELSPPVKGALRTAGIDALYEHQAEAVRAAFEGPMIVTTGTASGKSLCFQLPTLEILT